VSPKPELNLSEKRTLQIIQVQLALTRLGLYKGKVDGNLTEESKEALKQFQTVKGIKPNGLMTTDTLNALAIPAVQ
jgi:His-Xaa-Ser repeat protein HxsA